MKISIAYLSKFGNGKLCAEYLESVLRKAEHEAKCFSISDTKPDFLPESDIYVFSTPTHVKSAPFKMKGFLKKFNPKSDGAKYALVTTKMAPNTNALRKMDGILAPKGMKKVAELEIQVKSAKGPPEDCYRQKLDEFAVKITG
jgi:flavodoxin